MLAKRIIPCLDIKDGRTVKGINFLSLRDAGDAVENAARYSQAGADELVFLDITATVEKRDTLAPLVRRIADRINIPFTVGGGIKSVEDAYKILDAGADKISINSRAVREPELVTALSYRFGSQCVVCAIDVRRNPIFDSEDGEGWEVYLDGGRTPTGIDGIKWAKRVEELGAGEILLTSMNHDGTKEGFANNLTRRVSTSLSIPVIASGGAGSIEHFEEVFTSGCADAGLAASIFHYHEVDIMDLKRYLASKGISVRL
ncbi:MAG: imidazole glycerol phosphate synthase subunit HisF [Sphaerochaetaceae bacterium]|nr:imidazole glycerol phosphate synthase subunit HisF [Sphaerochaetaceae bacterium]